MQRYHREEHWHRRAIQKGHRNVDKHPRVVEININTTTTIKTNVTLDASLLSVILVASPGPVFELRVFFINNLIPCFFEKLFENTD